MDLEEDSDQEWDIGADLLNTGGTDRPEDGNHRVILHFDLDCFYAQVEMIRNPALRTKPIGVQQKYIIVTCNYVAREHGVTKLMTVKDALEKCPQLVLVNGEDLTHYREISYKVTELLMSYCPLVERLGFDENFVDATELVESRLKNSDVADLSFVGHVYKHDASLVGVEEHTKLALGSAVALEMRQALKAKLGLTGCAGIASNKLLAKLVSGTFKPNQQTTLLPQNAGELMDGLNKPCKLPGIGYKTSKKLLAMGIHTLRDLQVFPFRDLAREFGDANAKRIQNLACGIDPSPVIPTGPPQSLSNEDSFKQISTVKEVESKIGELLKCLTERMHKDGRLPQTLRLTLRRYNTTVNKWFSRESKQCPIPNHTAQRIITGCADAVPQLLSLAMKLFHKMVDISTAFHLTLLNVCFSNLQAKSSGKNIISSLFTQKALASTQTSREGQVNLGNFSSCSALSTLPQAEPVSGTSRRLSIKEFFQPKTLSSLSSSLSLHQNDCNRQPGPNASSFPSQRFQDAIRKDGIPNMPPDVDPDVFRVLPEHIQKELLASFTSRNTELFQSESGHVMAMTTMSTDDFHTQDEEQCQENQSSKDDSYMDVVPGHCTVVQSDQHDIPPNVDPLVFSQLPPDVRRELLAEWKQNKPMLKISSKQTTKQLAKKTGRDGKPTSKNSQNHNLLKYFKPN